MIKMQKVFLLMAATVLLVGVVTTTPAVSAPMLSDGYIATSHSIGSVKYRDLLGTNNNPDIYLGIDGLGTAANRVQQTFYGTGGNWAASNHVEFIYDKVNDMLVTNVTNSRVAPYQLVWNNFSTTRPYPLDPLNYLQIGMKSGTTGGTVALQNVLLDGVSLGSASSLSSADATYKNWYLSGYDFSNGFTLSADLVLTGTLLSSESSKVDMTFGCVPEPSTIIALVGGLGSLLAFRRRRA
jgi:hypothetical protein